MPVQHSANNGEGAGDDAEAHESADADFAAERHLNFSEDQDGEGREKEVGDYRDD